MEPVEQIFGRKLQRTACVNLHAARATIAGLSPSPWLTGVSDVFLQGSSAQSEDSTLPAAVS